MASQALARAEDQVESLRTRLAGLRNRSERAAEALQRKLVMGATGYAIGRIEATASARNVQPFSLMGMRTDLSIAAIGYAAATFGEGRIAEIGEGVADGALSVAAYRMGREAGSRPAGT